MAANRGNTIITRHHLEISGIVQGVGFRPFLYRLARQNNLTGWVRNTPGGVQLELQGQSETVQRVVSQIAEQAPPLAVISSINDQEIAPATEDGFSIISSTSGTGEIQIAPDSALCSDCLTELFTPHDRRHRYPFITCTNCGPRYSIITGTPYDRPNTTMAGFSLCRACLKEYNNPDDRRFHAQPLACPECGPQLNLINTSGQLEADSSTAIGRAVELLSSGAILAVKGLGGFHLVVDACNNSAVLRLRERKKRDQKPFAVMAADLSAARRLCSFNGMEERLLCSVESPIVIVRKSADCPVSDLVAPRNGWLGIMLPYTPIHHLLFKTGKFTALVMTSANRSDEPIVYENPDALLCLSDIADYFLVHDRTIHIRCDDSVMRVFQGQPLFYRRSRGYVPRPIRLPFECRPTLAVGSEMKNAICLTSGSHAFLSQHIGDLQNNSTSDSFRHTIQHLSTLLDITPEIIAHDQHPDYHSSVYATESTLEKIPIQHHHAHLAACMAENGLSGEVIGLVYDGTGLGTDGTIWGGEFLTGGYGGFNRAAHFRHVRLPGGDAAIKQPWRLALSYLYQTQGKHALTGDLAIHRNLTPAEADIFTVMLEKGINSPLTSSCGRLFDAVAALLDVRQSVSYDGQAAIELEALAEEAPATEPNPYETFMLPGIPSRIDFSPVFPAILADLETGVSAAVVAHRFHTTVAHASIDACLHISAETGLHRVVLSGGVFQNRLLTEMLYTGLTKSGLQVFTHRLTPPNDGCIALGQAAIAGWQTRRMD